MNWLLMTQLCLLLLSTLGATVSPFWPPWLAPLHASIKPWWLGKMSYGRLLTLGRSIVFWEKSKVVCGGYVGPRLRNCSLHRRHDTHVQVLISIATQPQEMHGGSGRREDEKTEHSEPCR